MPEREHPIAELLRTDPRYKFEAYAFVFEALNYAHNNLGMGSARPSEASAEVEAERSEEEETNERHLTGPQLCEASRLYAQEQFGYMAKVVLRSWGINSTGDLGEIVFNLIRVGQMRKTKEDRREDFDNVFDFENDLLQDYRISLPTEKSSSDRPAS
jgi:uncharacterized repeat protein (TIGR04138 family)